MVLTRRQVLSLIGSLPLTVAGARHAWTQTAGRVVVVGGGFGGATYARYLRRADATLDVTLVEPHRQFVTCPFSNAVLIGLRDLASVTHGYDALRQRYGVRVVHATATALDPTARQVTLDNGSTLAYDRLVLAPGIELQWGPLRATTPRPVRPSRTPSLLVRRPCCCAASSRPWRTAGWW
jgi:NADPH-dependent 2,4-dienoyl-CoA reductase/sulfur reductase-like enzyme